MTRSSTYRLGAAVPHPASMLLFLPFVSLSKQGTYRSIPRRRGELFSVDFRRRDTHVIECPAIKDSTSPPPGRSPSQEKKRHREKRRDIWALGWA